MVEWCVFVCSYAHVSSVCVCVPNVYLIMIQFCRAVTDGAGILSLGSSFAEFC